MLVVARVRGTREFLVRMYLEAFLLNNEGNRLKVLNFYRRTVKDGRAFEKW